jgi:SNF2 family DNA or RNA helicase
MPECRNQEELAALLDSCTFRALKSDWRKDLPPKTYQTVHLEMTPKQRSYYQTMMEEFYVMIDEDVVTAEMIVTQMGKLRQLSSGILIDQGENIVFEEANTNPKVRAMLELVDKPGKSIVVHYHKAMGKLLIEALRKAKFNPAYIQGGMKPDEIIKQKQKFNEDPTCRAIVGQERATALGHTLIGQPGDRCSKTIFVESSFSLYMRQQLEDRNHRGDQDVPCTCFDLSVSPMDELTVNMLKAKKDMATSMDLVVAAVRHEKECSRR